MFVTFSTTPLSTYNPIPWMKCYHATLPTQMRVMCDDHDDNNNDCGGHDVDHELMCTLHQQMHKCDNPTIKVIPTSELQSTCHDGKSNERQSESS